MNARDRRVFGPFSERSPIFALTCTKGCSPFVVRQNGPTMKNQVREVQVKAVLPLEGSVALFLGNEEKTFVIYVDEQVGNAISMFMRDVPKERPLTHDLLSHVLMAFGARVDRVVINDVNGSVFYARLIIVAENQLQSRKVIELDARPSDSVALAVQQKANIYVADKVWNTVVDVTDTLEQIQKRDSEEASSSADSSTFEVGEEFEDEDEDDDDDDDFTEDDLFEDDEEDDDDFDDEDEDEDDDESRPPSR